MIDLHLHTNASDGRLPPAALIDRARAAGLCTISVTDHDTVAATDEVTALAAAAGIRAIPGIEITAIDGGDDVHVLGYFIDHRNPALAAFLESQRARRVDRASEIAGRLARLGVPVDLDALLRRVAAAPGRSVGRPLIARALVDAGYVASVQEAFDRFLATGRPAYVPRAGVPPADIVRAVHDACGVASLAHPGVTRRDDLIVPLADAGLDAIEVYHSDHHSDDVARYLALAERMGLDVSGGSDFHGEPDGSGLATNGRRRVRLGEVTLPADALARLEARAARS